MPHIRCLLVYPEFTLMSFWNFRATCEVLGAQYPSIPLGLITVAAMLPGDWETRLVDCNVEPLTDADLQWADVVLTGGMLAQQPSTFSIIDRARALNKPVVVGGPDATNSPHLYEAADHQVLGEAEITLPKFLADFAVGVAAHRYEAGGLRADVTRTPKPRYDLLTFKRYLYVAVQMSRGCPFLCEFCDIIELFGRVPRLKTPDQLLAELDSLYALGYRGHVDFVDDNFIGNKRDVKKFLPRLAEWQEANGWPFEFSTEASINLADDDEMLSLLQAAGFSTIFTGIESPDEATLAHMQKKQNTRRNLTDSIRKLYSYGMYVNTGFILGFDTEGPRAAEGIGELIEASATAVNMVGMLYALPGTQLSRRLEREGRLRPNWDFVGNTEVGDQCVWGLNFQTIRPTEEIMRGYRALLARIYAPGAYYGRILRMARELNCGQKKMRSPLKRHVDYKLSGLAVVWREGVIAPHRWHFWRTMTELWFRNPKSLRYAGILAAQYLHFGPFHKVVLADLDRLIDKLQTSDADSPLAASPAAASLEPSPLEAARSDTSQLAPAAT